MGKRNAKYLLMNRTSVAVLGATGQFGTDLVEVLREDGKFEVVPLSHADCDCNDERKVARVIGSLHPDTVVNCAAYVRVDDCEEHASEAFNVNAIGALNVARACASLHALCVYVSTDYVFDGTKSPHLEDEAFSPLGVYGKTKAAGDQKAAQAPKNYILRTSWVIGEGRNFVRTMLELGRKGVNPAVVNDQVGRPTFTSELVRTIDHLLRERPPFGTYNLSNGGDVVSWADFTREIFKTAGFDNSVTDTTTADYYKDRPNAAKRPLNSVFDLSKIESTGFKPTDWRDDLKEYVTKELDK